jgi:[ribosomal protein S18]-alanine N-acetyltransferase
MGATRVSEAGPEASEALAIVEAACFDHPWTIDAVRGLIAGGLTRVWLVRTATGDVVGSAMVRVVAGEGEVLRIAVVPEARGQGIGRTLLRAVMSAIADACVDGVYLEVRASNVAARRLYAREGFVEQGRRRAYYDAPREDAVLMRWPARRCSDGAT